MRRGPAVFVLHKEIEQSVVVMGHPSGLRQGELFGLTIDRVDFLRKSLRVDRQLAPNGSGSDANGLWDALGGLNLSDLVDIEAIQ